MAVKDVVRESHGSSESACTDRKDFFLRYAGLLAAIVGVSVAIGPLLTACGDSPTVSTISEDLPDLEVRMRGPERVRLPGGGGQFTADYYSESMPREIIEREEWGIRRITDPVQQEFTHFGEGQHTYYAFTEDDANKTFQIRLMVRPRAGDPAVAFHETEVLPPLRRPIPQLLSPAEGEIMDNGCWTGRDSIVWDFDWTDVDGVAEYHLFVIGPTALYPVIDCTVAESLYHWVDEGSYIANKNRHGWRWKVRAVIYNEWMPWTPERTFDVELLDTDCP